MSLDVRAVELICGRRALVEAFDQDILGCGAQAVLLALRWKRLDLGEKLSLRLAFLDRGAEDVVVSSLGEVRCWVRDLVQGWQSQLLLGCWDRRLHVPAWSQR